MTFFYYTLYYFILGEIMKKKFIAKRRKKKRKVFLFIFLIFIIFLFIYFYYLKNNDEMMASIIYHKSLDDPYTIIDHFIDQTSVNNTESVSEVPVVYIYSTHEKESYQDDQFHEYNIRPNVKMMDYILKDYLESYGIYSIVEEDSVTDILNSNHWSYKYSYNASRLLIKDKVQDYSLVIDLHRDSSSLEKTLLEYNNMKYARILFVVGGEYDGYEKNYQLALNLSNSLNDMIPNISRGVVLKKGVGVNGIYNQDLGSHCILIELGGQYNHIEELNNSLMILSQIIANYLKENL